MKGKISSFLAILAAFLMQMTSCSAQNASHETSLESQSQPQPSIITGAERISEYLPLLQNKRIAMLVNQTSVVPNKSGKFTTLVDSLINSDIDIRFLMAPEHGLKGLVSAGDHIGDTHYEKRKNLQVFSLFGKNKKPQQEWLKQVDCVVFDIQDVGCRFYTYLSTLYYLLEACGENKTEVIVLDRPNPHDTIDGPMLDDKFRSFVGIVRVPLLHGCTLGELAKMIIGEQWIQGPAPKLTVIPTENWKHGEEYSIPIPPSPNLRTDHAIRLYPSLCLFEATDISIGRGTENPFEILGHPQMEGEYTFTPQNCQAATHPIQENSLCKGQDLRGEAVSKGFHLRWLLEAQKQFNGESNSTLWIKQNNFFDKLAGSDKLRMQIAEGLSEEEIRSTWQESLNNYRKIRQNYLLY